MNTRYIHRCMLVPAELAPLARALTEAAAGPPGAGMFTTGISPTGLEPTTHYISSGMIEGVFEVLLADPQALFDAIEGAVSLEVCTDLLTRSDISDEAPFDALARMGLRLINTEQESPE